MEGVEVAGPLGRGRIPSREWSECFLFNSRFPLSFPLIAHERGTESKLKLTLVYLDFPCRIRDDLLATTASNNTTKNDLNPFNNAHSPLIISVANPPVSAAVLLSDSPANIIFPLMRTFPGTAPRGSGYLSTLSILERARQAMQVVLRMGEEELETRFGSVKRAQVAAIPTHVGKNRRVLGTRSPLQGILSMQ